MGERAELKPDWEPILLRSLGFFAILNTPFLGVFKNAFTGELKAEDSTLLLVAFVALSMSLYIVYLFRRIRFGWTEAGVFKQGMFKRTDIPWEKIRKIYDTGELNGWTECDLLAYKRSGRRLFVIQSDEGRIYLDHYKAIPRMKKYLSARLNLPIKDEYNLVWDFLINS